ncbi:MAG TPA: hypothetical protein PKE69_12480 [Pyrinomonadaceae bacterium]|nr:hypothetical protein [Pyrinomonadaceae bacterium]
MSVSNVKNDEPPGILAAGDSAFQNDSLIKARIEKIQNSLKQNPPILLLEGLDERQSAAQNLAIKDERFLRETRDKTSNESLLNEIFGVYPLRESDFIQQTQTCRQSKCFRVEMYNFALNLTTNAVVDTNQQKVLVVTRVPSSQPDITAHLTEIAKHIATNANEVKIALGGSAENPLMANTKTSLNRTKCERSNHLCVAPTFVSGEKALWAIVDLTDLNLVGIRWTQVGSTGQAVTQKTLQNSVLTAKYCEQNNAVEKNGWKLNYMLTNSDGLKISEVSFNGKPILTSAKLVDWHVSYSNSEGFGYSDAVGCPYFSQAAVVAAVEPKVSDIKDGFSLTQKYYSDGYPTPCNYSYEQRYDFYSDGRFRVVVASLGRGCGNDGTYRPVTRIAFAEAQNNFAEWSGNDWKNWQTEAWQNQKSETTYTKENFQYKIANSSNQGFYVEANRGQFGDKGRGDNAFVYVTKSFPDRDEGESDLVTIASCCNTDYKQGPEKFIEPQPEPINNSPLVVWYVPQLKNDSEKGKEYCWAESVVENGIYKVKEYPCYSGAMFVPIR